jgi:hypothetical protein
MTHGDRPEFCGVLRRKRLTYGAARAIFPSLPQPRQPDTEAPSCRAPEVLSPLELAVDARRRTDPPSMAPGERNGNNNDRAFLMVGVPA